MELLTCSLCCPKHHRNKPESPVSAYIQRSLRIDVIDHLVAIAPEENALLGSATLFPMNKSDELAAGTIAQHVLQQTRREVFLKFFLELLLHVAK